ncbi:hypothetical protein AYK24_00530 [Thermoplasmatales archaeon SG8-52-4]|nr:MAG: hypothetical protein AYK24_00530 [Thermoplasmatales archaeon SG8-52-4]
MRVTTYHKRVWKVNHLEAVLAEPSKKFGKRNMASYNIESDYVGVVYSETEKMMELYVGYKVDAEKTIPNIIGLAVKLEINKLNLIKCEVMKHLKIWDHHTQVINKMLEKIE